jgi:hypothetical protein
MALIERGYAFDLDSTSLDLSLTNVNFKQSKLFFNGGYSFNFASILSGAVDVHSKNYSNFYLTSKTNLASHITEEKLDLTPESILTTIKVGDAALNILALSSSNFLNYDYKFNLQFTTPALSAQNFNINFTNEQYCTITFNDNISEYYLVLENNVGILQKSLFFDSTFSESGSQFFRYILNDDKIFLFKSSPTPVQLGYVGGVLSAIPSSSITPTTFREYHFTIASNIDLSIQNKTTTDYVLYNEDNLLIDKNSSYYNLNNNFLLYKNLDKPTKTISNIVVLKNQMTDRNVLSRSNTLALNNVSELTDLREYTSIFNDIDRETDEGLDLNYVFYNKSLNIISGINYFKTESSLAPYTQLNVNDTKFALQGSFPFNTPVYSDRIYKVEKRSNNTTKTYLCTWLSGNPYSESSIWIDRYYYPDLVDKNAALQGTIAYSPTYSTYLETLVKSSPTLSASVASDYYFDKKSDMLFTPDSEYIYERFDFNTVNFSSKNIYGKETDYYEQINANGGFTFACTLINQSSSDFVTVASKYNLVEGGVIITYNNERLILSYGLYDQSINDYKIITSDNTLLKNVDNNIVLNVNSNNGTLVFYLNGRPVLNTTFLPQYYNLLYGNIFVLDTNITEFTGVITDVLLTTTALTSDEALIYAMKSLDISTTDFNITLPCGMRNNTDSIQQINSITTNLKSKSNFVDVNISNLGISDTETVSQIQRALLTDIADIIPVNININNINFIS